MQHYLATHPASPVIALPTFAPLPVAMVLHILGESSPSFVAGMRRASDELRSRLFALEKDVWVARDYVYKQMAQRLAEKPSLPMKWLQDALAHEISLKPLKRRGTDRTPREYTMSVRTMNNWRENNILLPARPRKINLDRAAALLIAAIVDERKQGFVPHFIEPSEVEYWGWMQLRPDGPVLPCPFPPPVSLPAGTLYWSRWPSFNDMRGRIKQFPGRGSLGFVSIDQTSLERWDPTLANVEVRRLLLDDKTIFGQKMRNSTIQDLAEALCYRLAALRLAPSVPPPSLPLLWSPETWPPHTFA
jgi:hypothetical protein